MSEENKEAKKKSLEQRLTTIGGIAGTAIGTFIVSSFLYYRPDSPNLLMDIPCTFTSIAICAISGYYAGKSIGAGLDYPLTRKNQNE